MAFQNIDALTNILQEYFTAGLRTQISQDYRDWEFIKQQKASDPKGSKTTFMFLNSQGPSAVQRRNPGVVSSFPTGQRAGTSTHTAYIKELHTTVELPYNEWKRVSMSKEAAYTDSLQLEMETKQNAMKRQLSLELHLDGTGVLGTIASAAVSAGDVVFTLSTADAARGHIGAFQWDEICVLKAEDGTASAIDTDLATEPAYWIVVDRDFDNDTVTMRGLDSDLVELTVTTISVAPAAGEVFYKYGQPTTNINLTSITDYGTVSESIPGLESLTANDARTVHGITMSGKTAGSRYDAGNTQLDTTHIEKAMNKAAIAVGGVYSYKQAMLSHDAYSNFIVGREDDRRFNSVEDTTRGGRKWTYQYRDNSIELYSSEFAKKKRMYILPEAKNGQGKVVEYHGTDFEVVKTGNESGPFRMKSANGGGYENTMVAYLDGYGTLICKHPAAIAVVHNFTVA